MKLKNMIATSFGFHIFLFIFTTTINKHNEYAGTTIYLIHMSLIAISYFILYLQNDKKR